MTKKFPNDLRRSAIALSYKEGSPAPRVVAKGYGETADRIIARAREAGVFVHDSPELVSLLMQVDLDQNIPPDLYRAVAEVRPLSISLRNRPRDKGLNCPPGYPLRR